MSRLSIEIPEPVHREIKARASLLGLSMQEYVLQHLLVPTKLQPQAGQVRDEANTDTDPATSIWGLISDRPWQGTKTKAEIDAIIAEERASWGED